MDEVTDSLHLLSPADSLRLVAQADSLRAATLSEGIVISAPTPPDPPLRDATEGGVSWVMAALLLLFCVIALRMRNNGRYLTSLVADLVEVRERHNVFDDTVRETSFLVLLNFLWCLSAAVVLWFTILWFAPVHPSITPAVGMALCAGVTTLYGLLMAGSYFIVGDVFRDLTHARMWVRGFLASQAVMGIPFFVVALLLITMPEWTAGLLIAAASALVLAKILFISKGFRIFFTRISSWVLFLYYLCSLEIIPLILTYAAATAICALMS